MGSAAAAHLAARAQRVIALEQYQLAHDLGSSHGLTRIIRLAYFEHPSYVPLLRRAFELWRGLESGARETLLHITGGLDVGAEGSEVFEGSRRSCIEHDLPHRLLTGAEVCRGFPAWHLDHRVGAVLQGDAGFLRPEACITAHAAAARAAGADIRERECVLDWEATPGGVRVRTNRGSYEATQLVLAAGPWMGELLPALSCLMRPERQVLGWFEVADHEAFSPARFPVFVHDAPEGRFYGFPEFGVPGFKIGRYHHRGEQVNPRDVDRLCRPEDEATLRAAVARYFPRADGPLLRAETCLFTNTPDEHFIIDRHPDAPEVLIVSPCSGHGFKFCSVVGEIVADLVTHGTTAHDISAFRLARFPPRPAQGPDRGTDREGRR